ncbi:MAG: hypothetical protein FNNCIFGK_02083 [Bacteroidia bacterium]|nr:hypothetical protein [Bacteroidia bacterium]
MYVTAANQKICAVVAGKGLCEVHGTAACNMAVYKRMITNRCHCCAAHGNYQLIAIGNKRCIACAYILQSHTICCGA